MNSPKELELWAAWIFFIVDLINNPHVSFVTDKQNNESYKCTENCVDYKYRSLNDVQGSLCTVD